MAEENIRESNENDPPPPVSEAAPTAVVPDNPASAAAPSGVPEVPSEVSPRVRPVHPGFWWCVLWCCAFYLVTQIAPMIVGGILVVVFAVRDGQPLPVADNQALLRSPAFSQAMLVAFSLSQILSIGMVWLVLRLIVGKKWPHILNLHYPHWSHLALALIGLPALMFVSLGIEGLVKSAVPSLIDLDEFVAMLRKWPELTAVLIIGVGPGLGEELWFRGFMGRGLVSRYGVVGGVALTSLLFGLIHLEPRQVFPAMVIGVFLHLSYLASRSLLVPMILHTANNSIVVLASRTSVTSVLAVFDLPPERVSWQIYGAAILLLAAVGWAFFKTRTLADRPSEPVLIKNRPSWAVVVLAWLLVIAAGGVFFWRAVPLAVAAATDAEAEQDKNLRLGRALTGVAEAAPQASWRNFAAPDGSFQASFPGEPSLQEVDEAFEKGKVKRSGYNLSLPEPQVSFGIDYFDIEPAVMEKLSEDQCFHWVMRRIGGEVDHAMIVLNRPLILRGHRGKEAWIVGGRTSVAVRTFLVPVGDKTRLFLLTVRGAGVRANAKDETRFFDSFTCP